MDSKIRNQTNMENIAIKIINKSGHPTPSYETSSSAGMDLRANLTEAITLKTTGKSHYQNRFVYSPPSRIRSTDSTKKRPGC